MTNDTFNLQIPLLSFGFDGNDSNYELSGNPLTLTGSSDSTHILVYPDGSATVTINCPLVIADGGHIVVDNSHASLVFQTLTQLRLNGPITLGGGEVELILLECDVGPGDKSIVYVTGPVSGAGNTRCRVHQNCEGSVGSYVEFNGTAPNTFQGDLIVGEHGLDTDSAKVIFNKQTGVACVPDTARLVIEHGSVVQLDASEQIGDNAVVKVRSGGQLRLENYFETIGQLVLEDFIDSGDNRPPTVNTGTRQLTLNLGLACTRNSTNSFSHPFITGVLNLNGFLPIRVSGRPEPGLQIDANIVGNGFDKLGNGTLRVSGTNNFFGDVALTEGTLEALSPDAFGQAGPPFGVRLNGGNLVLQGVAIGAEPLFVNSAASLLTAIGACSWAGPVTLNAELQVVALDPSLSDVPFNISGSISGNSGVHLLAALFGVGNVRLSGSGGNTFTGPLTVNCQRLELGKPPGIKAYAGPLIVGMPGNSLPNEVRWLNSVQNVGAALTLYSNGVVNLNNFNEEFGEVTFNGGRVETGSGQFSTTRPLTVNPSGTAAVINGMLNLPAGADAVFLVGDGAPDCDLLINAVVFGTPPHVIKRGSGTMCLTGANTYSGTTLVEEGILDAANSTALGQPDGTRVFDNGTLRLSGAGTMNENLQIVGTGFAGTHGVIEVAPSSSFTLLGSVLMSANSTINVAQAAGLGIGGVIAGSGPLTKTGRGNLILSGAANNTYAGDTIVTAGTLFVSKNAGRIAVPGNLTLGPASPGAAAVARFLQSEGIGGLTVTVNANSLLDLNGFGLTLTRLNLNDGGDVQTGAGTLRFGSGAIVSVGSLSQLGSHASSSFAGNIGLPPNEVLAFNVKAYAFFPPFDFRPELDVPAAMPRPSENVSFSPAGILKEGTGHLRLAGANTYKGNTTVNGGTLQVDGAQPQSFAVVNPGAQLQGTGTVGHIFISGSSAAVAPGRGAGTLTCSNFNAGVSGSGVLQVELNGTAPGSGYDQLNVRGAVNLSGVTLSASLNFASAVGNSFTIINNDGIDAVSGTFTGLPQNANFYIGQEQFTISYAGGTGNDVVLTRIPTPPRPVLTIQRVPPAFVRLLWPTNAAGFALQFNTNLLTTNWAGALPLPVVSGTNNVVTNAMSDEQRFYRLFRP